MKISLLLILVVIADAVKLKNLILDELPDTGEQWMTLPNGVEVQPAKDLSPLAEYHLRRLTSASLDNLEVAISNPYEKIYVDGIETFYDEYAQAWRALGFYIDCGYCGTDDEYGGVQAGCYFLNNNQDEEDDREDEEEDEDDRDDEDYVYRDESRRGCQRFMLWAAYLDEGYSGHNNTEYMYFDRKSGRWNDQVCKAGNSRRCVKMDCHLPNTHFKLLGFFKEPNYDEWFEQLFKHQGDCVWTDEEYIFMQFNRNAWPTGCTKTIYTSGNKTIYYDVKPGRYGEMAIALYTDTKCVEEYSGNLKINDVMKGMVCGGYIDGGDDYYAMCSNSSSNYYLYERDKHDRHDYTLSGNAWDLQKDLDIWNDAFDVFKQCQPCKTFKLTDIVAGFGYEANKYGNRYNVTEMIYYGNQNYPDQYQNSDCNGKCRCFRYGYFQCYDAAGACDVNQCMKFATHTTMIPATWRDIETAAHQDSITSVNLPGSSVVVGEDYLKKYKIRRQRPMNIIFLLFSSFIFVQCLVRFVRILRDRSMIRKYRLNEQDKSFFVLT